MTVGLHDLSFYVPDSIISIDTIIQERSKQDEKLARYLKRAQEKTGQVQFAFSRPNEDTVTLALEAAYSLLTRGYNPDYIRYIACGTETGVDHSKPVSAYVQGGLEKAGIELPKNLSSFQVQHACAGATIAMASVGGLLALGNDAHETALVIASDIAKYEPSTTAEVTQGAGACAMLIGKNPRLLSFDLGTMGLCSSDVDDFFRPLGSVRAQVQGKFSMDCYIQTLKSAFEDHCKKADVEQRLALETSDMFVFHAPFRNMPRIALEALLKDVLGFDKEKTDAFLSERLFEESLEPISYIGNSYTASLYFVLAQAIQSCVEKYGRLAVGKTILIASYGSGNTMLVMRARIESHAPDIVRNWDLKTSFFKKADASFEQYEEFCNHTALFPKMGPKEQLDERRKFYIDSIRDDGYRLYGVQ